MSRKCISNKEIRDQAPMLSEFMACVRVGSSIMYPAQIGLKPYRLRHFIS